jgi:hypothetical protein
MTTEKVPIRLASISSKYPMVWDFQQGAQLAEIEQGLLGSIIVSPEAFKNIAATFNQAYFFTAVYARIFEAIRARYEAGQSVTAVLIAAQFQNDPDLSEVGGSQHIRDLADNVITVTAAPDYAEAIYKGHCLRALRAAILDADGGQESLSRISILSHELRSGFLASKAQRLKAFSWQELHTLPKMQSLIKALLCMGAASVMYGESNCGKTFLALDIAFHVALGWDWRGNRTRQGRVIYLAAEAGFGIVRRMTAFAKHHNLQEIPGLYLLPASVDFCSSSSDAQEVIRAAEALGGVTLIVVDTLARAMAGGNENGPDDMGAFIKNIDLIREKTGAHVLTIHHAGKERGRGARGHSSLRAAVDTEIEVTKSEDGIITAEIQKQRDGETGRRFNSALEMVDVGQDEDGEDVTSCVLCPVEKAHEKKVKVSGRQARALEILKNLLVERGEEGVPKAGLSRLNFVRSEDFRAALLAGEIVISDDPDNVRRGISAVLDALNNKGITASWEGKTWLAG